MRGANAEIILPIFDPCGSSPRAWGKWIARERAVIKITVHPHVRGANYCTMLAMLIQNGSSPRAWGKWLLSSVREDILGFIPTCVGQIVFS